MNKNANRWKKIVYEYDLISGKVNKVMYQPRYSDQFTHRYFYDAENRLTEVHTSLDGFTWEREAKYEYYLHGPLARTVLGQQQVQGMDYAYTLQGWLKGVNSTGATATHDIGADGQLSSLNKYVARDALGFNLNYFHGDYLAINPAVNPFPSYRTPSNGLPDTEYRPLYNGNISSMVSYIRKFEAVNHNVPIFYNYRYDQLNRYVRQDSYFGFNKATNTFGAWTPDSTFRERVAYDANGNIQTFVRHAINQGGALMDNLTYKYYPGTNQLRQVNDVIADNSYGTNPSNPVVDIDNQADTSNYVYDAIGNLIQDKAEKITNIQWNVYGKITEITRNALTTDRVTTTRTRYTYDAQGNRISKAVKSYKTANSRYEIDYTWYVRDAQGNLLSTYTANAIDTSGSNLEALALKQEDVQVYGSSRLGNLPTFNNLVDNGANTGPWINPDYRGTTYYRGYRQYELSNHLGNVLTTISDRRIPVYSNGSLTLPGGFTVPIADYFEPDMVSATDYYPFGMVSRGVGPSDKYRFGFNGQEMSNEVKGFGNSYTAQFWEYDPRIGRRWNLDPRPIPGVSEYSAFNNNPVLHVDIQGDTSTRPGWGQKGAVDLAKYKVGSLNYEGNIINKAGSAVNNFILAPVGNLLIDAVDGISNPGWTIYNAGEGIANGFTSLGRWLKNNPDPIAGVNIEASNAFNYAKENWNNPDAHLNFATSAWGVFGGTLASSNISIAQNFTLKSSGAAASGGLFRKVATNTGEFSALEVPMSLKSVKKYAREADIGLSGIKIKINSDPVTMRIGLFGLASGKRTITLFPLAFTDVKTLITTIGHERIHIWQYKTYGKKNVQNNSGLFEEGAYSVEADFWNYTKNKQK